MENWTLKYKETPTTPEEETVEQTFAEWNLGQATRVLTNQGKDLFTFEAYYGFDAELPFKQGAVCIIKLGDVGKFHGIVTREPRRVKGDGTQKLLYTLEGPTWYLEETVFEQYWELLKDPDDPSKGFTPDFRSHVLLMQKIDGTPQGLEAQILEIVQFAIDYGIPPAPISAAGVNIKNRPSDSDPTPAPIETPTLECRDLPCSEAIRTCLRYMPDASMYWDYADADRPVLHIARRWSLTPVSLPLGPLSPEIEGAPEGMFKVLDFGLQARHDLMRPGVVIKYEQINQQDGVKYARVFVDKWPLEITGRERKALVSTINLEGSAANTLEATIVCGTPALGSMEFWKDRIPRLAALKGVEKYTVNAGSSDPPYPFYLRRGQIAPWMTTGGQKARVEVVNVEGIMHSNGEAQDNGDLILDERIKAQITSTNLPSGTYRTNQVTSLGEAVPQGMARTLFDAVSWLQYEGGISTVEEQCSGRVGIGNVLNLIAERKGETIVRGRLEWESMYAQVQEVREALDAKTTFITVGPTNHLGAPDIMSLLRSNRERVIASGAAQRAGLAQSDGGALGSHMPETAHDSYDRRMLRQEFASPGSSIVIEIDPTDGAQIRLRLGRDDATVLINPRDLLTGEGGQPTPNTAKFRRLGGLIDPTTGKTVTAHVLCGEFFSF